MKPFRVALIILLSSCRQYEPWDYRLGRRAFITREMGTDKIPHAVDLTAPAATLP